MMMNNKKKKNKQHSKIRNQETKLRENINLCFVCNDFVSLISKV